MSQELDSNLLEVFINGEEYPCQMRVLKSCGHELIKWDHRQ
jgi:hypothetical protein